MSPVLYDFALDLRCYAVRLGASLMGKPLTVRDVDVVPGGEHVSQTMLALNPKGSVPVLVDASIILSEPAAILAHLAADTPWALEGPHALDWLMFASDVLGQFSAARHSALFSEPGAPDYEAASLAARPLAGRLRQLDDAMALAGLRNEAFLTGKKPALADILAFCVFAQSRDLRIEPEAYPALRLWARRIRALPGFIGMPGLPDYH